MTDEDGQLHSLPHLSSEAVVKKLLRSYKPCQSLPPLLVPSDTIVDFHNPNDPKDFSFKPHPDRYPRVELEYPNTHSLERCVRLFVVRGTGTWGLTPDTFSVFVKDLPHSAPYHDASSLRPGASGSVLFRSR